MKSVWWIHPGQLTLYFMIPTYVFIVYVVPDVWPNVLVLKGENYVTGSLATTALAMLLVVALFAMLGARIAIDASASPRGGYTIDPAKLGAVGLLTLLAYLIWFFPILLEGRLLLERGELNQTPGVTSFTQLGVPFLLCYLHCRLTSGERFPAYVRWELYAILLMTVARVFLWRERLALIEVAVPALVLVLAQARVRSEFGRRIRAALALFGPYLAIPVLLGVFTVTEYFRSWQTYAHTQSLPLLDFMTSRVVTYYFTALNNGAGMLATQMGEWPTYDFRYTLDWLYHFPAGVGEALRAAVFGARTDPADAFLVNYGDLEFNNMSGIFPLVHDLGVVGAGLYFAAFGAVAGMLYCSLVRGGRVGAMLFPPMFVGCLEILRIAYLNGSRCVLVMLGALVLMSQMRSPGAASSRVLAPGKAPAV